MLGSPCPSAWEALAAPMAPLAFYAFMSLGAVKSHQINPAPPATWQRCVEISCFNTACSRRAARPGRSLPRPHVCLNRSIGARAKTPPGGRHLPEPREPPSSPHNTEHIPITWGSSSSSPPPGDHSSPASHQPRDHPGAPQPRLRFPGRCQLPTEAGHMEEVCQ